MSNEKRLMKKKRSDLPIENIIAYYYDERSIELTPKEEEIRNRCESIYKKMIQKDSILQVIKVHMRFFDVSMTTAYRDIKQAQELFGSVNKFDKDFWRFIQIERKRNLIKRARQAGELEIELKAERDIDNLLDFDQEEANFNPEKLAAMNITVSMPDAVNKALQKLLKKGVVDLNDLEAEETDFEDVTPNE